MTDKVVYHYTSVDALFQIVRAKRFRLSSIYFMNDSLEMTWLLNTATQEAERLDQSRFAALLSLIRHRGFDYHFCGCFSQECDDLSQWRGYADDGRGVAIGVNLEKVITRNEMPTIEGRARITLKEMTVTYELDAQKRLVDNCLRECIGGDPRGGLRTYSQLSTLALQCKNPAFQHEREVRLVLSSSLRSSVWGGSGKEWVLLKRPLRDLPNIRVVIRNGRPVPYAVVSLPADAIEDLWLGPRFGDDLTMAALQIYLHKHGISDKVIENIHRSTASYSPR